MDKAFCVASTDVGEASVFLVLVLVFWFFVMDEGSGSEIFLHNSRRLTTA